MLVGESFARNAFGNPTFRRIDLPDVNEQPVERSFELSYPQGLGGRLKTFRRKTNSA